MISQYVSNTSKYPKNLLVNLNEHVFSALTSEKKELITILKEHYRNDHLIIAFLLSDTSIINNEIINNLKSHRELLEFIKIFKRINDFDYSLFSEFNQNISLSVKAHLHYINVLNQYEHDLNAIFSKEQAIFFLSLYEKVQSDVLHGVDDCLFKLISPDKYNDIYLQVKASRTVLEQVESEFVLNVKEYLSNTTANCLIESRVKSVYSIFKKIKDKKVLPSQITDAIGLRIITDNKKDCYLVMNLLNRNWQILSNKIKDYIAFPKENGYQSIHMTVIFKGYPIEIQIRSKDMHKKAVLGQASHLNYKQKNEDYLVNKLFLSDLNSKSNSVQMLDENTIQNQFNLLIEGVKVCPFSVLISEIESSNIIYKNESAKSQISYKYQKMNDIIMTNNHFDQWSNFIDHIRSKKEYKGIYQVESQNGELNHLKFEFRYISFQNKEYIISYICSLSLSDRLKYDAEIYNKSFNTSKDCKLIVNANTLSLVDISEAFMQLLSLSKSKILQKNLNDIFTQDLSSLKQFNKQPLFFIKNLNFLDKYQLNSAVKVEFNKFSLSNNESYYILRFRFKSNDINLIHKNTFENDYSWSFLEHSPDTIIQIDTDFTILYLNKDFGAFKLEDLWGESIFDLFDPYDKGIIREAIDKVKDTKEIVEITVKGKQYSDKITWYKCRISPIYIEENQYSLVMTATDITEQKENEERLKEAYKHLAAINRQVSILLSFGKIDKNNRESVINKALESALRLSKAKVIAIYKHDTINKTFKYVSALGIDPDEAHEIQNFDLADSKQVREMLDSRQRIQGVYKTPWAKGLKVVQRHNLTYYVILPLIEGNEVVGMLFVSFSDREGLSTQELDFYDVLAMQASYLLSDVLLTHTH